MTYLSPLRTNWKTFRPEKPRLMKRLPFAIIFLLIPFLGLACDCDESKTLDDHIAKANVIVLGTCNNIISNPIKGGLNVSFQVDSSWVRAIEPNATFHTKPDNQCGFKFEVGKRYIIFGNKRHQTVETSICQPNQLFEEGGEALMAKLGQGFTPGREAMAMRMNLILLCMGLGALLFIAFVVLRKRLFVKKATSAS